MYRLKNVSMRHMLGVLEYGYGFDLSQFDYLEFYGETVEIPYCLIFRLAGQHYMHILRIPRYSDENFFRTEIHLDSHLSAPDVLIDWRMLNISWFEMTFPTCDVLEVVEE